MVGETLINRYEILEKVGDGGMALVYRAKDTLLNRVVAVKVLREQFAGDDEFIERFRREAQSAASLSHPNVVNIYDVGHTDSIHFIVMEYVDGQNLSDLIKTKGELSQHFVVSVAMQIATGLAHAHHHGIIHRDIKPHNILITNEGRVKVTDFGIAQAMSSVNLTQTGVVLGSVHYFSPEQARGVNVQAASDLYSLGVVMYEMIVGKQPFRGDTPISIALKQIQETPIPPRQYRPDLHRGLEQLVLQLLAKEPAQRPKSADDVVSILQGIDRELNSAGVEDPDLDNEKTLMLSAVDVQDKEVSGLASVKGKRGKKKSQKPRHKGLIIFLIIAAILAVGGWAFVRLVPKLLFLDDVQVPDIVGLSVEEGRARLQSSDLILSIEREVFDNEVPANHIISQDPMAGRMVKQQREIFVRVSKGAEEVSMPSVVGLSLREARLALTQAGFVLGSETEVYNTDAAPNLVVDQSPQPGEIVAKGTSVDLGVSKGQEAMDFVQLPDFRGQSLAYARDRLYTLGLKEGNFWPEYSTVYAEGQIVEQNPPPGTEVEAGWPIDFVYSQGLPKGTVTVPAEEEEVERWTEQSQWQSVEVTVNVPNGPPQEVVILVIDDFGAREVYRETLEGGSRVVRTVQGRGEGAKLQVYIGARQFLDRYFKD